MLTTVLAGATLTGCAERAATASPEQPVEGLATSSTTAAPTPPVAVPLADANSEESLNARGVAFEAFDEAQRSGTGKKLVYVQRMYGYTLESATEQIWSWFLISRFADDDLPFDEPDRESAVAAAQAWIAAQRDPSRWDLVVIE